MTHNRNRRIAVIGGVIAMIGAAYYLSPQHSVTLFEAAPRLGEHARTVWAGKQTVDTDFIIFNKPNYPHLSRLFNQLEIAFTKSELSFSVSLDNGEFEYALKPQNALSGFLAQPRIGLNPRFLGW